MAPRKPRSSRFCTAPVARPPLCDAPITAMERGASNAPRSFKVRSSPGLREADHIVGKALGLAAYHLGVEFVRLGLEARGEILVDGSGGADQACLQIVVLDVFPHGFALAAPSG